MAEKIPMTAIGKNDDGVWSVAIADRFGWVEAGTGEPLDDKIVATWTFLRPVSESPGEPTTTPEGIAATNAMAAGERARINEPWKGNADFKEPTP